ncbi:carboxymuconolactone decarboxylase family protein [Glycomyces tarimensis]
MLAPLLDLVHAVRYEAEVPRALRELLICRLAQIEGSTYELAHHLPMARAAGLSEEQLEHLDRWSEADCFDDAETVVLSYAEHLGNGAALDADLLGAHFSPVEQTELTVTGATYIAVARILRALDVRIDSHLA